MHAILTKCQLDSKNVFCVVADCFVSRDFSSGSADKMWLAYVTGGALCLVLVIQDTDAWRRQFCPKGDTCANNDCCCDPTLIRPLCRFVMLPLMGKHSAVLIYILKPADWVSSFFTVNRTCLLWTALPNLNCLVLNFESKEKIAIKVVSFYMSTPLFIIR